MKDEVFRMYDIRGKVHSELVIDNIYDLVQAISFYFVKNAKNKVKTVAVGMDGRTHSEKIKQEVCKALQDSGINILFIGVCPSPVLYFSLFNCDVDAGLMITASHNSKEYNGIKICLEKKTVWGDQIQEIKKYFHEKKFITSEYQGNYSEKNIINLYIDYLVNHFSFLKNYQLKAVIDCGNGAAGTVLPILIEKMEWKNIQLLYEKVDGNYPNHEADPTVEKNMHDVKKILQTTENEIGIGFDGDADRMAAMTKDGRLILGDKLLAVFAKDILENNPNAAIVFDVKASSGLVEILESLGAHPYFSPAGHAIIKETMAKYNSILAGELSCHFFFADRYFGYDDGIYAMLRLFEILYKTKKSLSSLIEIFPKKVSSVEIKLPCLEKDKQIIIEDLKKEFEQNASIDTITIDGVRAIMNNGWGIIRASNTQPVLTLRFEANSKDNLKKIKNKFYKKLLLYFDEALLKQKMEM